MPRIATKNSDATESSMNINVHAEGTSIPIILTSKQCTSTTWGALCKEFVEKSLTTADSRLILHILTNISPNERLPHYVFRFGDGNSSIFRVNWSSAGVPGFKRVPLATGYIEVNVILKPVGSGAPTNMAKPHLPVRPAGANVPSSIDVDLCISVVSAHPSDEFLYPTTHQPFPSNIARTSLVYLTEHKSFPGCVDSFSIVAADGVNNLLPGNARMPDAPSAAAAIAITTAETTATTGKKRKAPSKDGATPTKAMSSKKKDTSKSHDDDGAKKPAAKDGKKKGGAAAATKKSPPEESAAKLKSPPKKSGADMIRLYEEAKAKELEGKSSGAKPDTVSIPKVISSKKITKISPKKDSGKSNAAEDSAKKASAAAAKEKSGDDRAPSADAGNEMIRLYEEAKAKDLEEKSSAAKSDTASIPQVISSKKTTKISPKKDSGKSNAAEDSAKKASAAAKEKSGDGKAPSADAGNEMIRLYNEPKAKENAAENKETPSKKSDDPTKSSTSKKAKGSSKKDEAKSDEGKSTKKPSATEEAKSAKKKAKEADAEGNKASKKKRKAPTDGESLDAPKSPSKKKAKTSKADESTPSKSDGEKSAAAKNGESEKKRGPKPKDYSDIPSEPVKDLPEGWTLKTIPRSVGDKYDQKWYSPGGIAFRTKKGATGFIEIFNRVNDEAEAYAVYQKEEKEAKELKKMEKEAKKKEEAESIVV